MRALAVLAGVFAIALPSIAAADETAHRSLTVRAEVATRTSLRVSTDVVHFDALTPDVSAVGTVEFAAGARTQATGEVLLIIEPLSLTRISPAHSTADDHLPSDTADRPNHSSVDVSTPGPKIAYRWIGSGLRRGTVHLTLRTSQPGRYRVPVRVVLAAP